MGLVIAIVIVVLLALLALITTVRRRDTGVATGGLSRETRRRDRSTDMPSDVAAPEAPPPTGREVERAAALERLERERPAEVVPAGAARVPAIPVDEETLGVTRRQFLNRGIVNMMMLSLGAFGAASLAFLWPS